MATRRGGFAVVLALGLASSGCYPPLGAGTGRVDDDVLSELPRYEVQRANLCARGRSNAVTAVVCDEGIELTALVDLQRALDIDFDDDDDAPGFSLLGNSSALPSRSVTALNPGVVIVSLPAHPPDLNGRPGPLRTDGNTLSLAYARGDQLVELVVRPPGGNLAFYLVRYEQGCNDDDDGCDNAALFTPATEAGWTRWSIYDDDDLKNTVLDCLHCHQPDGPGTRRILRMQELENPWTHWMATFTIGGRVLLDDYVDAHGLDEVFAGIPGRLLPRTDPVTVEDLMRFDGSAQPNEFPSPFVEREVQTSNRAQPADNSIPGTSPTWQLVYDEAVAGRAIPPPHHDVKITDPRKLASMTAAYVAWRSDDSVKLPDLRDVIDDDALAPLSMRPKPGLSGRVILVHMCAQCHNARLDQRLSRARFDALDLDNNDRAAKQLAIERLLLPANDRYRMPPHFFRDLSEPEIDAAIAALRE